jgi:DNA-binding PadR family transcriptional regulator
VGKRDWVLLAVAAAQGEPVTPVQLQKSLFLLGRELPDDVGTDFFAFKPYRYGPFSASVYQEAERLEAAGLLHIDHGEQASGRSWAVFSVTPAGQEAAGKIAERKSARAVGYLRSTVEWARGLTFSQLVSAIYRRYPEQRANSVFSG